MELPRRPANDIYLPDGTFLSVLNRLRGYSQTSEIRIGVVNAFDFRTRMLPYWYVDKRMAPCSVRTLADVLNAAGFKNIRVVLQQWTPNFRPSQARLDGKPIDLLLVSAMQVHAEPAYELIRDAFTLGDARPLIIAGGPKAIYEPTDYFELGPRPGVGADCVSTGEAYVLLELLERIFQHQSPGETIREAFERTRRVGALDDILGLVYLSPEAPSNQPVAVNTGVQRLLRDLDEMPMPDAGYRFLESPHKRTTLDASQCRARDVHKHSLIASVVASQGCRFNCPYCPIPSFNQRTWRHKSADRFAAEIKHIYENFGITEFFGTDDNFFNKRETVEELMTALAEMTTSGEPLARRIRFYTEGTQFDVYKNRDLLPLCRRAGLRAIWFGIEDVTAELVNKGQNAAHTKELFSLLLKNNIEPMVMMIHSDDQPRKSPRGTLAGVVNQAKFVFDIGAVSYQCTYLGPAVGTRDFETACERRVIFKSVAGEPVPQAFQDGNHVAASGHPRPWEKQFNLLRAYVAFYNPVNFLRVLLKYWRDPMIVKRVLFQVIGHIGLLMTAPSAFSWARRLKRGPIEVWDGPVEPRIPMVSAQSGQQMNWAIGHLPFKNMPVLKRPTVVAANGGGDQALSVLESASSAVQA